MTYIYVSRCKVHAVSIEIHIVKAGEVMYKG